MAVRLLPGRFLTFAIAAAVALCLAGSRAGAEALLLVEVESGKVLYAENATQPWYPASITKIMTTYVTLRAVREGRLKLDTLLRVSHNATAQRPVKMGFGLGTQVTVDNAIKMLMVKSANDIAVVLAEGVGGSIEGFADLMNQNARRLGMTQSHWVNPNGLPADGQYTSARDMAILARAAIREFPEYDYYWHLPGFRMGRVVQRNYNSLLGRYPGADGMKTGFICASGFNLVATATRDNKRMMAIVLGAPSSAARAIKAAQLLERGFTANPLAWLAPSLGTVDSLQPINADPPNLREEMCGKGRRRPAAEDEDDTITPANIGSDFAYAVFLSSLRAPQPRGNLLQDMRMGEFVTVFTGSTPGATPEASKRGKSKGRNVATEPKAKGGSRSAAVTPPSPAGNSGAVPWTSTSPASLANSPPPELAANPPESGGAVPTPQTRPQNTAKPKNGSTKKAPRQKNGSQQKVAAHKPVPKKPKPEQ